MRTSLCFVCFAALAMLSCEGAGRSDGAGDTDTGSVGDGDAGGDADADADSDSDSDPDTGTATQSDNGCTNLDILFVLDDSSSMVEEQTNLADNFPKFIDVINAYETPQHDKLDYRIGVTVVGVTRNFKWKVMGVPLPASTTGPDGDLQGQSKCALGPHPWLAGPGPNVTDTFSCMADVGTSGSGGEMPWAALELALGEKMQAGGANEGFYGKDDDSLLVVVMITDEDDCSIEEGGTMTVSAKGASDCDEATSTGLYKAADVKQFLDDVAGGAGRYVVVGIGGAKPGGCTSTFGDANYAKRLKELTDACQGYGFFGDICKGDLWESLKSALDIITVSCENIPPVE
ncbi:MAG: hypothetical protein PHU25_19670 [Deltaproteobacteria bacterium]|nr:hypothetical protein [Deltaproteobacteria bacterium]